MRINNQQEAFNRAEAFFVEGCVFYYVTSDGNVFLQENKHFAYNHANKALRKKLEVFEVEKPEIIEKPKVKTKRKRKNLDDGTAENNI